MLKFQVVFDISRAISREVEGKRSVLDCLVQITNCNSLSIISNALGSPLHRVVLENKDASVPIARAKVPSSTCFLSHTAPLPASKVS